MFINYSHTAYLQENLHFQEDKQLLFRDGLSLWRTNILAGLALSVLIMIARDPQQYPGNFKRDKVYYLQS